MDCIMIGARKYSVTVRRFFDESLLVSLVRARYLYGIYCCVQRAVIIAKNSCCRHTRNQRLVPATGNRPGVGDCRGLWMCSVFGIGNLPFSAR